jgi:hypothetical protein
MSLGTGGGFARIRKGERLLNGADNSYAPLQRPKVSPRMNFSIGHEEYGDGFPE